MMIPKLVMATGLFLNFSFFACASTNNGGHVVGNPIIAESVSTKLKTDDALSCACASSKDAKVRAKCKCASDVSTSVSTSTTTVVTPELPAPPAACKGESCKK